MAEETYTVLYLGAIDQIKHTPYVDIGKAMNAYSDLAGQEGVHVVMVKGVVLTEKNNRRY